MQLTTSPAGIAVGLAGADRAQLIVEPGAFDDDPLGAVLRLRWRPAWRRNRIRCVIGLATGLAAKPRRWVTDLRWPGSSSASSPIGGQVVGIDPRAGAFEMAEFAQFLGRHRDLVRAAAPSMVICRTALSRQRIERMGDDIAAARIPPGVLARMRATSSATLPLPITTACRRAQRRVEIGEIGVAVVPADKRRAADHAGRSAPGMSSGRSFGAPVASTTASYSSDQLVDRNVAADRTLPTKRTLSVSAIAS